MIAMQEMIVFVDEVGKPTGEVGPKLASHHAHTKRHLAFSCYVFNDAGELLVSQRALSKKVWPGVWSNSFCGHPMPSEPMEAAIARRADQELGMQITDIQCILPIYRYTTPPFEGIIENEFCPVYIAQATSPVQPNPNEVEAYQWMTWPAYQKDLQTNPNKYSYWAKDQLPKIAWALEAMI
jgi:isopentenyl-diphosphate delta-isomerase